MAYFAAFLAGIAALPGTDWTPARADELKPARGSNLYQKLTGDDGDEVRKQRDSLFSTQGFVRGTEPAAFLKDNAALLPKKGRALDLAMAEGRNTVFLARQGLSVEGIDVSKAAVKKARKLANLKGVRSGFTFIAADPERFEMGEERYDVIVSIDFLRRPLISKIKRALRKGGLVFFDNWTTEQLGNEHGPELKTEHLLAKDELKELFKEFEIVVYHEGNDGKDARASLVARKP
jgi:tellurite methyltransferase